MLARDRRSRRPGVAASAALLLLASRADADTGVVVLEVPEGPARAADAATALARAAEAAGDRPIRDAAADAMGALRAGALPRGELERFRRTRELVDEGWRAYLQVSGDVAAARLVRARDEAEALLPWDGGREVYADIALRLGAVLDHLGRRAEAAESLRLAAWLDPARPVTTAEFSPDVVAAFDAARAQVPAAVPTRIEVTGQAGRVPIVEIDGRSVDVGGVGGPGVELPAGQHVAVARAPGLRPRGVRFSVAAPRGELSIALEADPDAAALVPVRPGLPEEPAARALDAIQRYAEADAIVLAAPVWRQGRPALLGQRCAGGRCSAIVEVEYGAAPGGLEAAAVALWRGLGDAGELRYPPTLPSDVRVAERGAPPVRTATGRCRWCRNPWIWVGVGAAAIAVGATAAVIADGEDRTIVVVDPGDFGGP